MFLSPESADGWRKRVGGGGEEGDQIMLGRKIIYKKKNKKNRERETETKGACSKKLAVMGLMCNPAHGARRGRQTGCLLRSQNIPRRRKKTPISHSGQCQATLAVFFRGGPELGGCPCAYS
ncbi:hypothetical protein I7I48_07670 [Histoplasma ohiense]|nr:hypothetical protein I7I48_07670 [Histoplasma ohiense (nom. inval.)]